MTFYILPRFKRFDWFFIGLSLIPRIIYIAVSKNNWSFSTRGIVAGAQAEAGWPYIEPELHSKTWFKTDKNKQTKQNKQTTKKLSNQPTQPNRKGVLKFESRWLMSCKDPRGCESRVKNKGNEPVRAAVTQMKPSQLSQMSHATWVTCIWM